MQNSSATIRRETERYMTWFKNMPGVNNGSFDPDKDLNFYPFLITATLLYGHLNDETVEFLRKLTPLRERLFKYVIRGGLARFWVAKLLPMLKFNRLLKEFQEKWTAFNEEIYKEKKMKGENSPIIAMWEMMLRGELPRVQLLQTLDESLFANLDVTSGAVGWNFMYLAANPQIQTQLLEEIKQQFKNDEFDDETWDRYISSSNSFLAACINESSRMRPFSYFSIPQAPPTDRKVGDWIIPKNTQIIVDAYALNNRPEFWGDNTDVYDPSRFRRLDRLKTRYNLWRFGFGPRQCMGKHLADHMLRSVVSSIILEYEVTLIPDDREGTTETGAVFKTNPDEWITKPESRLGCRLRGGK
ncbi:hypothetical protein NHQ30_007471 [Ciborinia camelliae]|nr:hypothetical protein NHQ30_007471 [Ciborinia camelliae]